MKDKIIQKFNQKRVLILGFGKEGKSTYKFFKNNNIDVYVTISDQNEITDEEVINEEKRGNIQIITGENYLENLDQYDYIIKSPGISFKNLDLSLIREKITSQTEIFLEFGSEKIIGITGTKGKSTTSSLVFNILKEKYNVRLVGNIGLPVFEEINEYDSVDYFVCELSSHQLEFVKHSPKYAVILNMYEEHLDHYNSYDDYKNAKRNIFRFQEKENWYIFNEDEKSVLNEKERFIQNTISITLNKNLEKNNLVKYDEKRVWGLIEGKGFDMLIPKTELIGLHNKYNIAVATTICKLLKIEDNIIKRGIESFKTLPHRLEFIGEYNGIKYVDDSISTIPQAAISAVNSIKDVDTILIGGMDRNVNYEILIDYIKEGKIPNVILMYDSGMKIYEAVKETNTANIVYAETLENGVRLAKSITKKGKICLLSPASASYGIFKNFEERGNKFKEYVLED